MRRPSLQLALAACCYALALAQRPGKLVADTKVHLYVNPGRFLGDVLSAWSPTADLGHVWAGQYGGYAFPMAPWFALGHAAGVAPWLVQRLWLGTLLAVAAWGMVVLLDALWSPRRGVAHAAAAGLYVLNPYVAVYANRTSVALLAYAALPWLLLCVHRGMRDPRGWRWPAIFALVLTATGGGVNVAVTGWLLVGPLLLVLYERAARGVRGGVPFALRLAACSVVAQAWWVVPVLVHRSYGTNFLPFSEQPGTIWSTTSVSESLRLMGFWTSYIGVGFGGALRPFAGHGEVLVFNRAVVIAGLLMPACALAGLHWTRRRPYAGFFLALALLGVIIMAAGWPEGTPLRRGLTFTYNHVLALQFLRTTYKAGPLVALAIAALGGGALGELWARLPRRAPAVGALAGAAALAAVAAWPLTTGRAPERQLEFQVPAAWHAVASDLDRRGDGSRALIEPGQLFAFSTWGGTIDEVLPALTDHPVASRYILPFADLRSADLQWTVDDLLEQRRWLPGQVSPLLDLMGVGDLVLAGDRDRARGGGSGPVETAQALAPQLAGPGRDYGPARRLPARADALTAARTMPELRRVSLPTGGIVRVLPRGPLTVVDGSAQGIADLAAFGRLDPGRLLRLAGDLSPAELRAAARDGATVALTDSNRRQAFVAARIDGNRGAVLPAGEGLSADGTMLDPAGAGPDTQTVAVVRGVRRLSAPFSPQVTQFPEHRPFAALDGDPRTAWLADRFLAPVRRHLDVTFDAPRDVPSIDVLPYSDSRGVVTHIGVNGQSFAVHRGWNHLALGLHRAAGLQLIMYVKRPKHGSVGAGGIRELRVPGLRVSELLRTPVAAARALQGADLSHAPLELLLDRVTADDPGLRGPQHGPWGAGLIRDAADPEPQLGRLVTLPAARRWDASAWVSVPPTARDDVLDGLLGVRGNGRAWSSSRYENRPSRRASAALDGNPRSAWIGQWIPGVPAWLAWSTRRPVTLRRLVLGAPDVRVRRPTRVRVSAGGVAVDAAVAPGGRVVLPRPLRGRAFRLDVLAARFPAGTPARSRVRRAVGISELRGAGLRIVPGRGPLQLPCGVARLDAGGTTVALRASGSRTAFQGGRPLRASACGSVALPAGAVTVRGLPADLTVDHLRLASPAPDPIGSIATVSGRVLRQGDEGRGGRSGVRVQVDRPAWLMLGESYDRGWRATCDGHDLGAPVPIQGYANGWPVAPGCRAVSFSFAPDRVLRIGYLVTLAGLPLLLLAVLRRRPAVVPESLELVLEDRPRPQPPARALALGLLAALIIGFVFSLRAGAVGGPIVALCLWRGVLAGRLVGAAAVLLLAGVPIAYLLARWDDRGGYNSYFAVDHRYGHWIAVAALCLLGLALARTLSTARGRDAAGRRSAP